MSPCLVNMELRQSILSANRSACQIRMPMAMLLRLLVSSLASSRLTVQQIDPGALEIGLGVALEACTVRQPPPHRDTGFFWRPVLRLSDFKSWKQLAVKEGSPDSLN